MVTFARNRKLFASASTRAVNQGEIDPMGANGQQSMCPKEHSFCSKEQTTTQRDRCFDGSPRSLPCLEFMFSLPDEDLVADRL
jgi:hypothetical protein